VRFSGFDDFNLMYKRELKSGLIRRHRFLFSNFLYNSTGSTIDFRTGYAIGHEKRKKMNEVFSFIHGPEVALVINYQNIRVPNDDRVTTVILQPSFGYIIGFQYDINEHFYISVEVIAALSGSVQLREMQDTSYTLNAGFNSNSSALTLVYRFNS